MGELKRATVRQLEELAQSDASWWPGFCGRVAEKGLMALTYERNLRGWAWSGLWKWITEDEGRNRDYLQALEAYVQTLALDTVEIADKSGDAKLMVDTRFRLAGKVDRKRWGDKVEHSVTLDAFGEMLRRVSERKLAALRAGQVPAIEGRVIERDSIELGVNEI